MISIIVPTYNRSLKVYSLVSSIIYHIPSEWELIVVDDGSNDDTFYMLSEFKVHKNFFLFRTENNGVSFARNFGASKSSKKYLKFHDSDDILDVRGMQKLLISSEKLSSNFICIGDLKSKDLNGNISCNSYLSFHQRCESGILPDEIFFKYDISTLIPLWPKKIFDQLGGFSEEIDNGEDTILAVKAYLMGYRFFRINSVVGIVCEHLDSRLSINNEKKLFFLKQTKKFLYLSSLLERNVNKKARYYLGARIWSFGRCCIHNGEYESAFMIFSSLKRFINVNDLNLNIKYKLIASIFGPFFAEKIFISIFGRTLLKTF